MFTVLMHLIAKVWDPVNEFVVKSLWTGMISRTPKHFHWYLIADFLQFDLLPAFTIQAVGWVVRLKVFLVRVLHQVEYDFG